VVPLAFLLSLDRIAHRALDRFAVLVPGKKKEIEDLRYQMTNIPARFVLGLTLFMALVISAAAYLDPAFIYEFRNPVSFAIFLFFLIFSYSFAPILLYHSFRQLNLVTRAYRMVREINLFHLQPLYAFSGLTMASSFFWILILNMTILDNFVFEPSSGMADILLSFAFNTPLLFLAFATFLLPLWGIHRRIQNKKEAELEKNGVQIEKVHQTLYSHLKKNDYKKGNELEKSLSSLYKMREQIEKVPTWPWAPGTLRGLLGTVLLPIALWLIQRLLGSLLG